MSRPFDYFVIFAGMRTGSNFLEECLNNFSEISCYGEAFNPHFFGYSEKSELLGMSIKDRDNDPVAVIDKMKQASEGIPGFRFFSDHDERIKRHCLEDPRCAKIILYRNPVESFVSLEIARKTDQWRLSDVRKAKTTTVKFNPAAFEKYLSEQQDYQHKIRKQLQVSGQTAFFIAYPDIADSDVISGISKFLGVGAEQKDEGRKIIRQNPAPLAEKVDNYAEMASTLAGVDFFGLAENPVLEPRRGPAVPTYVASSVAPILFMPIRSCPSDTIIDWMGGLDDGRADVLTEFTQKTLRQWKRNAKKHSTFTVIRHPVARLFDAYLQFVGPKDGDGSPGQKSVLKNRYEIEFPDAYPTAETSAEHKRAFLKFADFVKANLAGQTGSSVDGSWASISETMQAMAAVGCPGFIIREEDLHTELAHLALRHGLKPNSPKSDSSVQDALNVVYDDDVESAVRSTYQRDYMMFGYGRWNK